MPSENTMASFRNIDELMFEKRKALSYRQEMMFSLGDRASFFVPDDIEQRLKTGSREPLVYFSD